MERAGTVVIVGVGLIGGSIGRALRERGLARRVVGVGRSPDSLREARRIGAIDEGTTDLDGAVADAEIAVIATPVGRVAGDAIAAAKSGPGGLLVTDAGSTKRTIVAAVEADPRARAAFVAAHPIAGSEKKGPAFARADLLDGRACVLTPTDRTPADRLERARDFWAALGCRVSVMSPEDHDEALAYTSHLPHAVAAALAASVPVEWLSLAAGAYRDGTRVAGSDPALWASIFRENRRDVLEALEVFQARIDAFRNALDADDADALVRWYQSAKLRRDDFVDLPAPELKSSSLGSPSHGTGHPDHLQRESRLRPPADGRSDG